MVLLSFMDAKTELQTFMSKHGLERVEMVDSTRSIRFSIPRKEDR